LDEIEKAHPDIYNVLLQVMDHATLTDNTGRQADFRNVILIMTTNAGAREMIAAATRSASAARWSPTGWTPKKALERTFSARVQEPPGRHHAPSASCKEDDDPDGGGQVRERAGRAPGREEGHASTFSVSARASTWPEKGYDEAVRRPAHGPA
jgi:hypothetical protein